MRQLIRNKRTKHFLTKQGEWTDDIQLAHDFSEPSALEEARQARELKYSQVYFLFGDQPSDALDFVVSLADL